MRTFTPPVVGSHWDLEFDADIAADLHDAQLESDECDWMHPGLDPLPGSHDD